MSKPIDSVPEKLRCLNCAQGKNLYFCNVDARHRGDEPCTLDDMQRCKLVSIGDRESARTMIQQEERG